jgi:hypothetical protein
MKHNRSVPPPTVVPVMSYPDVRAAVGWLTAAYREYGERDRTVADVAGHRWQFAETVRNLAPEDYGCTTVAPWPGRPGA